jgi:hypothetical protein
VNQSGEKHDECLFSGCCGNALKQKLAAGRMGMMNSIFNL